MSTITPHMPSGSMYQQAAAWMLVVVSLILFGMIVYKIFKNKYSFNFSIMNEGSPLHTALYLLIFALVFSATLSFFL
jgi:hypothetical protein